MKQEREMPPEQVSVVLSTYNQPQWLAKALVGYAQQSVRGFEIVIANDGSGTETEDVISEARNKFADRYHLTQVRHEDNGFRKWQIVNDAIVAAGGSYLVFSDGDCIPQPDFIEVHMRNAEPKRFLTGGYFKLPMTVSEAIKASDIEEGRAFNLGWLRRAGLKVSEKWVKLLAPRWGMSKLLNRVSPAAKTFNGNNASCWREDALRVNGFDRRIAYGGGDREFGYRLEHAGVLPKVIRFSTTCLHLDHPRGYKSAEQRAKNDAIIEDSKASRRVRTEFGIS